MIQLSKINLGNVYFLHSITVANNLNNCFQNPMLLKYDFRYPIHKMPPTYTPNLTAPADTNYSNMNSILNAEEPYSSNH